MDKYREIFSNINIKDTGFYKKNESFYIYCSDNNIYTIQDMIDFFDKNRTNYNKEKYIILMYGIINIYKYKYCNEISDSMIAIMNLGFKYPNRRRFDKETMNDYSKFFALGLTFYECWVLFEFSKKYSESGQSIIFYIKEFLEIGSHQIPSYIKNKFKLLNECYDKYNMYKNNDGIKRLS